MRVRALQEQGHSVEEIAALLGWSETKVLRYVDDNYRLPRASSLRRQPVDISTSIGKPAVKPLIAALNDRDPLVRRNAAEALGKIEDFLAVEPLIDALRDRDPLVRRHVAKALGIEKGRIVEGFDADLVIADGIENLLVEQVFSSGKQLVRDGEAVWKTHFQRDPYYHQYQ